MKSTHIKLVKRSVMRPVAPAGRKLSIQGYANVTSLAQRLDGAQQAKLIEHDPKSPAA